MTARDVEWAHDMRMPLQLIASSAQMIRLSLEDPTLDANGYVDLLMESVDQLKRMLDAAVQAGGAALRDAPGPVNADLAAAVRGDNELVVTVRVPSGITVSSRSVSRVVVTVEPLSAKTVDVDIQFTGTFDEGEDGSVLELDPTTVEISGAQSLVDQVTRVRGQIAASDITEEAATMTTQLTAVDETGHPVEFYLLQGADHGGPEFWTEQVIDLVDAFMKKVFA